MGSWRHATRQLRQRNFFTATGKQKVTAAALRAIRIRYASSPALADAAVYFKSGSLFECAKEAGFTCRPYAGNVKNYMNSTAIIESPAVGPKLYYMSTLVTNILRKNSAVEHQELATRLQQLLAAKPAPK